MWVCCSSPTGWGVFGATETPSCPPHGLCLFLTPQCKLVRRRVERALAEHHSVQIHSELHGQRKGAVVDLVCNTLPVSFRW